MRRVRRRLIAPQFLDVFTPSGGPDLAVDPDTWTKGDPGVAAQHMTCLERATAAGTPLPAVDTGIGDRSGIVILAAVNA